MSVPISPTSTDAAVPAVNASNTGSGGLALYGHSLHGHGVEGASEGSKGVVGTSADFQGVYGHSGKNAGVVGESATWVGVYGRSLAPDGGIALMGDAQANGHDVTGNGTGVLGASTHGPGVQGTSVGSKGVVGMSTDFQGVYGHSEKNAGVVGESAAWVGIYGTAANDEGVHGETKSAGAHAGVTGVAANAQGGGPGVFGQSLGGGMGVFGRAAKAAGVAGLHGDPHLQETSAQTWRAGVFGASEDGPGVIGYARDPEAPGVEAFGGVRGVAMNHRLAGEFLGDIEVNGHLVGHGNITCHDVSLLGADCAENFDIAEVGDVEAGDVVVIGVVGDLQRSSRAYDKRVAGVVSGAGTYTPGIVMDDQPSSRRRLPVALMGKVYCKVDASHGAVDVGDLLTTSTTPGHAMRAGDPGQAFGTVIGKALGALATGAGLVPILVCLQ